MNETAVVYFEFMLWMMAFLSILLVAGLISWTVFNVKIKISCGNRQIYVTITILEEDHFDFRQ